MKSQTANKLGKSIQRSGFDKGRKNYKKFVDKGWTLGYNNQRAVNESTSKGFLVKPLVTGVSAWRSTQVAEEAPLLRV